MPLRARKGRSKIDRSSADSANASIRRIARRSSCESRSSAKACGSGRSRVAQVVRPTKGGRGDLRLLHRVLAFRKSEALGLRLQEQPEKTSSSRSGRVRYKISTGNIGGKQKRPGDFPGRNFLQEQYSTVVKLFFAANEICVKQRPNAAHNKFS